MPKFDIHYLYKREEANYSFLQLISTCFYILKLLHNNVIINAMRNVFLYVYNHAVIHPLITHSHTQSSLPHFRC